MHQKGKVISGQLKRAVGIDLVTYDEINTDQLGTFSGEIERIGSPRDVVLKKALLGAPYSDCRFLMATEGSFGPHRLMPFLSVHHEIIIFYDRESEIPIFEEMTFDHTNFGSLETHSLRDERLENFFKAARFGTHAVIVRPSQSKNKQQTIIKGIFDYPTFASAFTRCLKESKNRLVRIETDMRAHCNPTRMLAIRRLTRNLMERLASFCPRCSYPGWDITGSEKGLPCEECGQATSWVQKLAYECNRCGHTVKTKRTDGKTNAPSESCEICNP